MKSFGISPQTEEVNVATIIRKATINDVWRIYNLYKTVAIVNLGSLTQQEDEISLEYVSDTVRKGLARGLILVIENDGQIVSYLKAFTSEFRTLAHVLTNATMMIHPEWQGRDYGSKLINAYLQEISVNMSHILRFELLPHQSNQKAIQFYKRHGFMQESLAEKKIRTPKENFEAEVTLVWFNLNFSKDALQKYHAFLSENYTSHYD
jgi:L-amino acid N-acyltransferase YncA